MDADLKKLKKITSFMRKQGILNYKTPELELSLAPAAILTEPLSAAHDDAGTDLTEENLPLEASPIFNWSIPGLHPSLESA